MSCRSLSLLYPCWIIYIIQGRGYGVELLLSLVAVINCFLPWERDVTAENHETAERRF